LFIGLVVVAVVVIVRKKQAPAASAHYVPRVPGAITFTKDIAPIVFKHCAVCHRPDQAAPFSLLAYENVRKHAQQIVAVTQRRYMPPWLPEPGYVRYAEERLLSADELGMLKQWAAEGAPEGRPTDLPPLPTWKEGWQLGVPDLVVKLSQPFILERDGLDVYRNFTLPIPMAAARHVAAVEFRADNWKPVHHAAMRIDRTRYSRQLDERSAEPGFPGMTLPETTEVPGGHFLNWQPGKLPYRAPPGLGWTLEPGADLVAQLHLHPSGKPEAVAPEMGFYFTESAPTNATFKIILDWPAIDIPAGARNYAIEDSYTLPVAVQALAVFPHAHYLAKEMQAYAMMPDGARRWLLRIADWDFNWQGDYRFADPILLPKGTTLHMRFTYDNSTNNLRNPQAPPRRVVYGTQTTDEMGELWLQVLPRDQRDWTILSRDYTKVGLQKTVAVNQHRLRSNPLDGKAHLQIGKALFGLGRRAEAQASFRQAASLLPRDDEPRYFLGLCFRIEGQLAAARQEFQAALLLNSENFKTHGNLGLVLMDLGEATAAEEHFRTALRLNPQDAIAQESLETILKAKFK
jgi:tetratricopeptide (TPR) repeat protein